MKIVNRRDNLVVEKRFLWGSLAIFLLTGGLLFRMWYLQVYKGEYYKEVSERNRIRRTEIPAPRGIIYDRHGEVLLGNRPFFDLVYIPQYVKDQDTTLKILSRLLHAPISSLERRLRQSRNSPKFLPTYLKRNLSLHEVSVVESNKVFLPGIEVKVAPRRDYRDDTPPHIVGYLHEIDDRALKQNNENNPNNPYFLGDLVGIQGLELRWEELLRGSRGYRLIQVDAYGRQSNAFDHGWELPILPAVPGSDLELTIDLKLQKVVQNAFNGKYGAVVVLNPQTGEILAKVSEPVYDPEKMQTGISVEEWRTLVANPFKPFLDKTTGGEYPPGSIYKTVVALAALEEGIVNSHTTHNCPGHFVLGNQIFNCHHRAGHGRVNLRTALMKSCDVFFYQIGAELGVDRIAKYAKALGLGRILGVELNSERAGNIPTAAWKMATYKTPWALGDTPNIAIGQGYNLLTPMQMANLYATIANNGKVWKPYIVRKVTNHIGSVVTKNEPELLQEAKLISPSNYKIIRDILQDVVMSSEGTGHRSAVAGVTVAGKTGSAQVVSLKRNRNQTDVSMKWKEHAIFTAFSPVEDAEIAVAIISENDEFGGGGRVAAPIAQKIIEAYWQLKKEREQRELYQARMKKDAKL